MMLRSTTFICMLSLALAACGPAQAPTDAHAKEANKKPASTQPATQQAPTAPAPDTAADEEIIGSYTEGDVTLQLRDSVVLQNDDKKISILMTPNLLSDQERAAILERPRFPGMALHRKSLPDYPGRYPYVKVELTLQGPVSADNVSRYYIMAYGISAANHTDNLNGMRNDDVHLELLEVNGEHVRLKFSGKTDVFDEPRSWMFDIDA